MQTLIRVFLFFFCNLIGSSIGPILYFGAPKLDMVNNQSDSFNAAAYYHDMVTTHYLLWIACALFSFAFFFLSGYWRKVFLFSPIVVPLFYGIASVIKYM